MSASPDTVPGADDGDRVQPLESPLAFARRRFDGRFQIDAFGGDAQLMDLAGLRARVRCARRGRARRAHPSHRRRARSSPTAGSGSSSPPPSAVAVRLAVGRRLRIIGAPDAPVLGDVLRKIGAVGYRADDVAALLRAGHLAAAPLASTWLRSGAGAPPRELLAAILGYPVVPAAVLPGGPGPLPIRPWRVVVGPVVETATDADPGDTLAGAELAERTRTAVNRLLADARRPEGS